MDRAGDSTADESCGPCISIKLGDILQPNPDLSAHHFSFTLHTSRPIYYGSKSTQFLEQNWYKEQMGKTASKDIHTYIPAFHTPPTHPSRVPLIFNKTS